MAEGRLGTDTRSASVRAATGSVPRDLPVRPRHTGHLLTWQWNGASTWPESPTTTGTALLLARDRDHWAVDSRRDQVQLAWHSSVLTLVAEARLILSGAGAKYPMIALALMSRCGGKNLQRACIADFPATVLSEAARAINTQEAARAVLAALETRLDELGSAAINAGTVTCKPDPLAMALRLPGGSARILFVPAIPRSSRAGGKGEQTLCQWLPPSTLHRVASLRRRLRLSRCTLCCGQRPYPLRRDTLLYQHRQGSDQGADGGDRDLR
jgi:hypothetical protein